MKACFALIIALFVAVSLGESLLDSRRPLTTREVSPPPTTCGHDVVKSSPWFEAHRAEFDALVEKMQANAHLFVRDNQLLRIPVVWHVLYDTATSASYVTRDQILSEMTWVNDWYSGRNQYYNDTDMFSSVVASGENLKIRFELATVDPDGNAFDGIRYVESSQSESCASASTDNFYTSKGGDDLWDPTEYYNVYTCKITDGASGFAYLPTGGYFAYDGAVLDYSILGNPYYGGSVFAHESGHWLGLSHTFNGDSCSLDDNLSDTPDTDTAALNWVSSSNPCNVYESQTAFTRCSSPAMVRNVMDYNYEECHSYFSQMQAARMRSFLTNSDSTRYPLNSSPALPDQCDTWNCLDRSCGDDGCGGQCGYCATDYGYECAVDATCRSVVPVNVDCNSAEGVTQSTSGYTVTKDNTGVTASSLSCNSPSYPYITGSLWYKFTAAASGTAQVSTAGSSVSTVVSAVRVTACSGGTYYCLGYDASSSASLSFSVTSGTTYYIVVAGQGGATGSIVMKLTMVGSFTCTPNCGTRECGDDGCGSVCGSCSSGQECDEINYVCLTPVTANPTSADSTPSPTPSVTPSSTPSRTAGSSPSRSPTRSRTPTRTPSTTPSNTCNADAQCAALGYECGTADVCDITYTCGTCASGYVCSSNVCQCPAGTTDTNGECVSTSSTGLPDYSSDFSQASPSSPTGYEIDGEVLNIVSSGDYLIVWDTSADVVDKYTTKEYFTVTATSGDLAFGLRYGQSGSSRVNDRIEWRADSVDGSTCTLRWCMVYAGNDYCSSFGSRAFPTSGGLSVNMTMSYSDSSSVIVSSLLFQGGNTIYNYTGTVNGAYYPSLGSMSFGFTSSSSPRPSLTDVKLSTSSTLTVSLSVCINDADWEELFYSLTQANPQTTSVQIRGSQENANCKGLSHGKALVSAFTFTVSSFGIPASTIADSFVTAASGTTGFNLGITSAGVVAGSEGAVAAGFVTTAPAGAASLGSVAGGGGGAAGGLSGGAIAGIVIGSVAGGILLLGLTAVVIGAIVVGAVMIARQSDSDDSSPAPQDNPANASPDDTPQRLSLRRTLVNFFNGVDVMNHDPNKPHQSISARSPGV